MVSLSKNNSLTTLVGESQLQNTAPGSFFEKLSVFGRMIKFSHTVFALPFALSAVVLATRNNPIKFWDFLWILIAMVSARSAAMGFNRLVDAHLDRQNPRTKNREIPSGQLSPVSATVFILGASAIFLFSAAMLGSLCFQLSIPILAILLSYSYTKRFTWLCHLYLGFAISLAPFAAWIAITKSVTPGIILLSIALFTYITGFDILYACQDIEVDRRNGLYSIPASFGIEKSLLISSVLHIISFLAFALLGAAFRLGVYYFMAVVVIGLLLIIEHKLVKPEDLSRVNVAFFHMNSLISVTLFLGILASEAAQRWL